MRCFRHLYKPIPKDSDQSEDIPLRTVNKKPLRRIYKCPDFDGEPGHKEKLQTIPLRFGPFYCEKELAVSGKKAAWKNIWKKSVDRDETSEAEMTTLQNYMSAMKKIEKDAMDAYGDSALDKLAESEFQWMMIEDGCFFLHLALLILGVSSNQLGYPDDHIIFGQEQKEKNTKMWIKSMFFVGNQIPLVVLNELMKQKFFQDILKEHENSWNVSPDVSKRILYEYLVLPAYSKQGTSPAPREGFGGKFNCSVEQHPSDLLHALHCLMFGSGVPVQGKAGESGPHTKSKEEDYDLESGPKDGESSPNVESKDGKSGPNMESRGRTLSATELKKKGIRFGKLEWMGCRKIMGCRDIKFKDYLFYPRLYLPTFVVDDDTETLWESLKYYEMTQQQKSLKYDKMTQREGEGDGYRKVRSYLQFMNDLICTDEDVRLLAKKGIIKESKKSISCDKYELPKMLSKLAGKEKITTQNHHRLRTQLRDYDLAPWERLKVWAILIFILTFIQTFFAMFAYFRPTIQK